MNLEEHNLEFEPEIKFSFEAGGQTLSGPCQAWLNWNQCDKQGCPFEHEWRQGLLNEWTPKQRARIEWRNANPGKILELDSLGWPIHQAHQKILNVTGQKLLNVTGTEHREPESSCAPKQTGSKRKKPARGGRS